MLEAARLHKSYDGVEALAGVDLRIEPGTIHGLVGENGSGKSTLIKILGGAVRRDSGELRLNGRRVAVHRPINAIREGVQVIYQDFALFPNLSVAENVALNTLLAHRRRFVRRSEMVDIAREAVSRIGVDIDLRAVVSDLSVAERQLVAISRALLQDARLIILDEPTAALAQHEIRSLLGIIRRLRAEEGISFLFVSHKLDEVLDLADRLLVLRNGRAVLDVDRADVDRRLLVEHMTGSSRVLPPLRQPSAIGPPLLEVDHLQRLGAFHDISLRLRSGEILGLAGVLGSGRTALALALFGAQPADAGNVSINGDPVRLRTIRDALNAGIAYVPNDRLTEGLFLPRSVGQNIVVRRLGTARTRLGLLRRNELRGTADRWIDRLAIRTPSRDTAVSALSGGNQQRTVLARWLAETPRILILNGPTVGVDVGSKSALHEILKDLAARGMGLLVVSDDTAELAQVCHRVLVMKHGRIVHELAAPAVTEDRLAQVLLADE